MLIAILFIVSVSLCGIATIDQKLDKIINNKELK